MPFPYITHKKFHLKIWESISGKYFEHIERWHNILGQNKWLFCKALGDFSWFGQLPNNVLMRDGIHNNELLETIWEHKRRKKIVDCIDNAKWYKAQVY